ncbi:RHS repeat-associated core domain-containing protein, partial [Flavobacterium sp. MC2016-06]|uniref:RHS repeat-associated core domain-containing protein n=1 Tax=Flavobacterium sp. MC2016-06 TaxID=2676308 RepID=UPI0031E253D3
NGVDNKYKYNGKELQDESIGGIQLNLYDYGARNYDPALGRWMNIDPLATKYVNISPYVYVANTPVNAFDPDGKKIVFAKNATKEFKEAFKTAIKHLKANKADGIFAKLQSRKEIITIEQDFKGNDSFSSNSKTIKWDPTQGLLTNEGVVISATTALNHEGDHALQSVENSKQYSSDLATPVEGYDNKEEQRVIEGSEQETAKALGEIKEGEVTRKNHRGDLIETIDPTSTTAANEVIIPVEVKPKK